MKERVFAAFALLFAPIGGMASASETISFTVGDVKFTAIAPEGYCIPKGEDEIFAAEVAIQDTSSFTSLTLIRCDLAGEERGYDVDFLVIKTPFRLLSAIKSREELLGSLSAQMGKPDWEINREMDGVPNQIADTMSRNFATAVSVEGTIRPRGVDSICAYLGGKLTGAGGSGLMGSCVTSVDGKVMTIHSYGLADGSQSVENLMRRSRAVALSIKRVAP
ncbi:hypothetical protein [Sphingopyxis sp.]|uniref:hypothetical protein n=1 Tax=Sphingopyxis sp. TaxID=1908224 RepID=UPI002FC5894A